MKNLILKQIKSIEKLKRFYKQSIVIFIDFILYNISLFILLYIISNFEFKNLLNLFFINFLNYYLISISFIFISFIFFKIYKSIFRYFGLKSIVNILYPIAISFFIVTLSNYFLSLEINIYFIFFHILFFYLFLITSRLIISNLLLLNFKSNIPDDNLIFLGVGNEPQKYIKLFENYKIIGFIDFNNENASQTIDTYPIFNFTAIDDVITKYKVKFVFVIIKNISNFQRSSIENKFQNSEIILRFLPNYKDTINRINFINTLRDIRIEDLIDRKINKNENLIKSSYQNKKILITGAGGSIGKELCIQILHLQPNQIILIDNSEYSLYLTNLVLDTLKKSHSYKTEIISLLKSINNSDAIKDTFTRFKPEIVFHAAAYKHVSLVETNPIESIKNNVFGSLNVIKAALYSDVKQFILISTDKAVRPSNVMGATKRLSEIILQSYVSNKINIEYNIVRFGNVIGSKGSVIPLFNYQIKQGIPITVTDPNVTRYFMTIGDAVNLVLNASLFKKNGSVFVLNMGKPICILDLAKKMIKLSGKIPRGDPNPELLEEVPIKFIGLKEGEKLHEELFITDEIHYTENKDIMVTEEKFIDVNLLEGLLNELQILLNSKNEKNVINWIFKIVNKTN